jgi:hypothetical protein
MTRNRTILLTAIALSAFAAPALAAAPLAPAPGPTEILSGTPASHEMAPHSWIALDLLGDKEVASVGPKDGKMSADDLAEESGAQNTVVQAVTDQSLMAQNKDNIVAAGDSVTFGDVSFGAGAFTGFNGIGIINVNTGANSNLQGAIGVNIVPN